MDADRLQLEYPGASDSSSRPLRKVKTGPRFALPKPSDYLLNLSDLGQLAHLAARRTTPRDLLRLLITVSVFLFVILTINDYEAGFFAAVLTAILAWSINGHVPLIAALILLTFVPALQLLYNANIAITADQWAERVAVWAYYMLAIGVIKRAVELFRSNRQAEAEAPHQSSSPHPDPDNGGESDPEPEETDRPAARPYRQWKPQLPKLTDLPKLPALPRIPMGPVAPGQLKVTPQSRPADRQLDLLDARVTGHQEQPTIASLRRQRILDRRGLEPPESILLQGTIARPAGRHRTPIDPGTGRRVTAVDNIIPRRRSRP